MNEKAFGRFDEFLGHFVNYWDACYTFGYFWARHEFSTFSSDAPAPAGEVIPSPKAVAPLSGAFLIDEAELKKKQEQVANESKSPLAAEHWPALYLI